jgi:hypothetical protein
MANKQLSKQFKPLPYTPRTDLTAEERGIESAVGEYFGQNLPALIREYRRRFGNVIDRNNVQELYSPYAKNRESRQRLSLATHEPAGALADAVYFAMVAKCAPESKNIVLFNAGGQGSGKTTSLRYSGKSEQAFIVMDGTMQDLDKSCRNIELAFSQGKEVHINYVYCPFRKAVENIIRRACHIQGGRVVNIKRAAKGHFQAMKNIFDLVQKYEENEGFSYSIVDNSGERPALMDLEALRAKIYPSIDALEEEGYSVVDDYYASFQANDRALSSDLYQRLQGVQK